MVLGPDVVLIAEGYVFGLGTTLDCVLEIVPEPQVVLVSDNPDALVLLGILIQDIKCIVGRTVIAYNEFKVSDGRRKVVS